MLVLNGLNYILLTFALSIGLVIHLTIPKAVVAKSVESVQAEEAWQKFTKKYNRKYPTEAEYNQRQAIFKANLAMINKHNREAAEGIHSYTKVLNKYADLVSRRILLRRSCSMRLK